MVHMMRDAHAEFADSQGLREQGEEAGAGARGPPGDRAGLVAATSAPALLGGSGTATDGVPAGALNSRRVCAMLPA